MDLDGGQTKEELKLRTLDHDYAKIKVFLSSNLSTGGEGSRSADGRANHSRSPNGDEKHCNGDMDVDIGPRDDHV